MINKLHKTKITRVKIIFILTFVLITQSCKKIDFNVNKEFYLEEQLKFSKPISNFIVENRYKLYTLNQNDFTNKIDSLRSIFTQYLIDNKRNLDEETFTEEKVLIKLSFDRFLLEYPELHKRYTGNNVSLSKMNQLRLKKNLKVFNDTTFSSTNEIKKYITSYIRIEADKKLESDVFGKSDNQQLQADLSVIDKIFTNNKIKDFWKHKHLNYHINNFGIKNIEEIYLSFMTTCESVDFKEDISKLYDYHKKGRENHIIETYKEVSGYKLDMHLFLPNYREFEGKRPIIIKFHGGSWSEGKPDWFFSTAESYAKQGWVVAVVEYRIKGRHNTYPFESVKDAKSAMRWIRENSKKYNLDSNKIIATGDSAGGHLSLALALVDNWNESSDNIQISALPNAVIVNSGVFDLTTKESKWITEKFENKEIVKDISPNHLLKKTSVKILLIHGEKDMNCPYETAVHFYKEMKALGNDIQLHTVKGGDHWIWFGKHSEEVSKTTNEFIRNLNF